MTGKEPIGCRWLDVNKGDSGEPEYRSRLVAQEIKRDDRDGLFAATPPLEAKKALFNTVMTNFAKGRKWVNKNDKLTSLFVDVKRAYFYADACRPMFVKLPAEDAAPGMVGRLNKAMYGTRDAASNWEKKYGEHLERVGFITGKSTPCAFYHPGRDVR